MSSIQKEENANLKLAQLKFSIDEKLISTDNNCNWIFQKLGSINNKALATAYIKSNSPELIGCSALHFALENKNLEAFEILLNHGADFTAKNQIGSTALHSIIEQLCSICNPSDIQEFKTEFEDKFVSAILTAVIKFKNFDNPYDRNGLSHFHAACMMNHVESVQLFVSSGVLIHDAVNNDSPYFAGYTPLHFAAKFFALETVEVLSKHGANRNLKDAQGFTPLHLLLERSIKYVKSVSDNEDISVADIIRKIGKIVKLFIDDDDDMMVIDEFGFSEFHLSCITQDLALIEHYVSKVVNIDHAVNMDSPLCPGYTGLHFAALFSIDTVQLLMKKGANFGLEDAKGMTPFDLCLEMYKVEEIHTILSLHPVWKDIIFGNNKAKSSRTVLRSNPKLLDLVSAMKNQDEFVAFVRKVIKKSNVFIPQTSSLWPGYTPLHVAVSLSKNPKCWNECEDTFKELREHGADFNAQDARGRTPLNLAFRLGKDKIVELLMILSSTCKSVSNVDEDGLADMHILCANLAITASGPLISNLLSDEVNINMTYKGRSTVSCVIPGSTPLHVIVTTPYHYSYKICEAPKLLEHGADVNAKDSNGMTPIHLASTCGGQVEKLVEILMSSPLLKDTVAEDIQLSHLHVACYVNVDVAVVEKLIELGADVNKEVVRRPNENIDSCFDKLVGCTPLYFATLHRNRKVMELLIQRGADILAKNPKCSSPLYLSLDASELHFDLFVSVLKSNVDLQKRMESDVGLTMLHVACRLVDVDLVKDLLAKGADVNAQVRSDSPIWPAFGPLHVWASFLKLSADKDDVESFCEDVLKILLEKNADVTLSDAAGNTPLHLICENWSNNSLPDTIGRCTLRLLQAHRDFRVNPVNVKGTSLFHLACMLGELNVAEKLLKHGKVDVNKPVDPFSNTLSGCTPLGLAIRFPCYLRSNLFSHVEMVDMLLRHGANVHAEDIVGDTPLHYTVRYCSVLEDMFDRLVREGADVNEHNVKGHTSLELLLRGPRVSMEKVRHLVKCGCRLNARNPVTGQSYWELAFLAMNFMEFENLVFDTSINFSHMLEPDEKGCTIVHNIVSNTPSKTFCDRYCLMLRKLLRRKCDVDHQDKLGRTALHLAARCFHDVVVSELFIAGADINIIDSHGQSALSDFINIQLHGRPIHHGVTIGCFVMHLNNLLHCGLHVSPIILKEIGEKIHKIRDENFMTKLFEKSVEKVKHLKIGSYAFRDFLSELRVVSDYPTMSQMKRDAIDEFFMSIDNDFCEKHSEVVSLLRLQYRKALARVKLAERADESLIVVTGFRLPDVCSQIILKLLPNADLKNLIASTLEYESE